MGSPEVRVQHLKLAIRAYDGANVAAGIEVLEDASRAALLAIAQDLGDEVLVLKQVALNLRLTSTGSAATIVLQPLGLSQHVERALRRLVTRARATGEAVHIDGSESAWYASEAIACAERLLALWSGEAERWPFSQLSAYGAGTAQVIEQAVRRGRAFAGDMLAHAAVRSNWSAMLATMAAGDMQALVGCWRGDTGGSGSLLQALPSDVRTRVRKAAAAAFEALESTGQGANRAAREKPETHSTARRLTLFGELFKAWPPSRTWSFSEAELNALQSEESQPRILASTAGALVFWAVSLERLGFHTLYAHRRQLNAVYWVLGRALERAALPPLDPLLALFGGEEPGAALALETTLRETDSEPLSAAALGMVAQLAATIPLKAVPFGNDTLLFAGHDLILDSLANVTPSDAVPTLVKRMRSRTGRVPVSLEVVDALSDQELETAANSDAPIVPYEWRSELRAVVSILRYHARRTFNADPQDLQGWPALIHERHTIELRLRDANGVSQGNWVLPRLTFGGVSYKLVLR